jgi:ABC-2 type transport system permease protein
MLVNPLTYGVAALRRSLYAGTAPVGADVPTLALSIFVTCGFAVLTFLAARSLASRPLDVGLP